MDDVTILFRPVGQKELDLIREQEYWIPAEELNEFNQNIVGPIEVIGKYREEQ